jgi:hypothetical protein
MVDVATVAQPPPPIHPYTHPPIIMSTTREDKTEAALEAAKLAAKHNVDLDALPKMMDLSPDNITENVLAINSGCNNPRMKFLFQHLVSVVSSPEFLISRRVFR